MVVLDWAWMVGCVSVFRPDLAHIYPGRAQGGLRYQHQRPVGPHVRVSVRPAGRQLPTWFDIEGEASWSAGGARTGCKLLLVERWPQSLDTDMLHFR